jgi:Polysaccharide pyruvyl transferase.
MPPKTELVIQKCLGGEKQDKIIVTISTDDYNFGNYGDLLARYITEQLSGLGTIKYAENFIYHLCAVGSVLNGSTICSNAVVWGSGFLSPWNHYKLFFTKIRQKIRGRAGKPVYLAVRGAKTREKLLKQGYDCPAIYGDPALIMPKLYLPKVEKKYKLGIILHWKHTKFKELFKDMEGIKIIEIERDYSTLNTFVDEVLSCDNILSSSLHGLVIANAYKVPCARLKIVGNPIATKEYKDDFKFEDYLSGLNLCKDELSAPDYTLPLIILPPAKQDKNLISLVQSKAAKPQFIINLTKLVHAFPFLKAEYKDKEFKV